MTPLQVGHFAVHSGAKPSGNGFGMSGWGGRSDSHSIQTDDFSLAFDACGGRYRFVIHPLF
jgi:hypothetical protein